MQKKVSKIMLLFTVIPLVLIIISSLIDEGVFFYIGFIIYPVYLGIIAIYYCARNKIKYRYLFANLTRSIFVNHLYMFIYYIYKQIQFDKDCELNNYILDLDGIIPFFLIIMFNYFIFVITLIILGSIMIVKKHIKQTKNLK